MMKKILSQGAEAVLVLDKNLVKDRIPKRYRHPRIDAELRSSRTNREAKILRKLEALGFPAPRLVNQKQATIEMQFLLGKRVRDVLTAKNCRMFGTGMGRKIRILHDAEIIHGDLTTSNMLRHEKAIYFVDFGLSFFSPKVEDKAVDLHLLRQALESKHYRFWKPCFASVLKAYGDKAVIARLEQVEKRGRNKAKY